MVAGISLNGKITDHQGDFAKYSSLEDKEVLQKKIKESDVLVMGMTTYKKHIQLKKSKKPLIIFTRSVKGMKIDEEHTSEIHFFHDQKEELINLCDLLQYEVVTILGGAEIYHWFLEQKLLTDIYLTIEPIVFGEGKNLLKGNFFADQKPWKLIESKLLNKEGTTLLHYQFA